MSKIADALECLNWKTLRFNFKYLPFRQAIKFPIVVSRHCRVRRLGGTVRIDSDIHTAMIHIGFDSVGIFDNKRSRSIWENSGTVIFKGRAILGHGTKLAVGEQATLCFGTNFSVTAESSIIAFHCIEFGDNCLLSWEVLIMDTDFHGIYSEQGTLINNVSPVLVGNNVWVGCRSTILKGVKINDGTVIAAGSVVTRSTEESDCIVGGNPIKVLKKNIRWQQ